MTIAPIGLFAGDYHLNGVTLNSGGALKTQLAGGDTALLKAFDTSGLSYTTFATLTAGNPPTFDLSSSTTIGGLAIGTLKTLTGNSGGAISPTAANINILGSGAISITGAGSTLTVSSSGGVLSWTDVTSATQTLAINMGYVTNRGGGVAYTLPATATEGDIIRIAGKSGAWTVAQNANQQITIGSTATTVGAGGSLASTDAGDCIEMLCTTSGASTIYRVISSMGNITVV